VRLEPRRHAARDPAVTPRRRRSGGPAPPHGVYAGHAAPRRPPSHASRLNAPAPWAARNTNASAKRSASSPPFWIGTQPRGRCAHVRDEHLDDQDGGHRSREEAGNQQHADELEDAGGAQERRDRDLLPAEQAEDLLHAVLEKEQPTPMRRTACVTSASVP
jgi:hypothetical protein